GRARRLHAAELGGRRWWLRLVGLAGVGRDHLVGAEPEVLRVRPERAANVDVAEQVGEASRLEGAELLGGELRVAARLLDRQAPSLASSSERGADAVQLILQRASGHGVRRR